jgi:hypothetical protein
VLNLIAGLMKDQGLARARYRGPYPSETLFTALLECFRHDPAAAPAPLEPFLAAGELDWLPAPHERHWVAAGVCVQLRQEIDKVVLDGVPYYRPDWQSVGRREPRLIRTDDGLRVCVLWALGRTLEERLVLAPDGEIVRGIEPKADSRARPTWCSAPPSPLIARKARPPRPRHRRRAHDLVLEWVRRRPPRIDGDVARVRRQLLDVGLEWIRDAEGAAARGDARARSPSRWRGSSRRARRAQARLGASRRRAAASLGGESVRRPPLGEAVGRLSPARARHRLG